MSLENIIAAIEKLNVLELVELTKTLQDKWSLSIAPEVRAAAPDAVPPSEVVPSAEVQTEFNVILKEVGAERIKVIKVVRELLGLSMKEARDLVDTLPRAIKEAVSREEADMIVGKLAEVGAKGEIN
jgi:large subunit ribosomal protein L7/L12